MMIFNFHISAVFTVLFLLTSGINAYAQTDYIITNDGVKLMGEVKNHNVDKVKFTAVGEKKSQKFNPEDIKEAYKAGHGIFCSMILPGDKSGSFVQLLENGKIKLYEFFKNGYTSVSGVPVAYGGTGTFMTARNNPVRYWYAQKEDGELVEIKSNMIWGSRKNRKDNFSGLINHLYQM